MTTTQDVREELQGRGVDTPQRLSQASIPWLHRGMQSGTLDAAKSAANLASAIGEQDNPKVVPKLQNYFENIKRFDATACATAAGLGARAPVAFDLLGLRRMAEPPTKIQGEELTWAVKTATAMGVADMLMFVGEFNDPAPLVLPQPLPQPLPRSLQVSRDVAITEDWVSAFVVCWEYVCEHPTIYQPPPPSETQKTKESRGTYLLKSAKRTTSDIARCNLEVFVYTLQVHLMGDPEMTQETLKQLVRTEHKDGWTEEDIEEAARAINMTQLSAATLFALAYHAPAVISPIGIVDKPVLPYLRMWLSRGNLHAQRPDHPLNCVIREFLILALRAALGLEETLNIPRLFFETACVQKVLSSSSTMERWVHRALSRPANELHSLTGQDLYGPDFTSPPISEENPKLGAKRARSETADESPNKKCKLADEPQYLANAEGEGGGGAMIEFTPCPWMDDDSIDRFIYAGRPLTPFPWTDEDIDWFIDSELTPPFEPDDEAEESNEKGGEVGIEFTPCPWTDEDIDRFIDAGWPLTPLPLTDEDIDWFIDAEEVHKEIVVELCRSYLFEREDDAAEAGSGEDIAMPKPDDDVAMEEPDDMLELPNSDGEPDLGLKDSEDEGSTQDAEEKGDEVEQEDSDAEEPDDMLELPNSDGEPDLGEEDSEDEGSTQDAEEGDEVEQEASDADDSAGAKPGVAWLAVMPDLPPEPERETYWLQERVEKRKTIRRELVYPLAKESLEIEYWEAHASKDSEEIFFSREKYIYRPFKATDSDMDALSKMMLQLKCPAPCPPGTTPSDEDGKIPLHVHPNAQKYPSGPEIPGPDVSAIYVVHEARWKKLTHRQIQEASRGRSTLIVSPEPYNEDGRKFKFDLESMARFTRTDRWAATHDLGRKNSRVQNTMSAGKPADLIYCREERIKREERGDTTHGQAFNILSNRTPGLTPQPPPKWREMASHTALLHFLFEDPELPAYQFPWEEFNWVILANRDAMTWIHTDTLSTVVTLPTGKKLWLIGRRKSTLRADDHRGDMRSRFAFDGFNGWTDMTEIYDWEMVTLTPNTTLYMPATTLHAVLSIDDCIGAGSHYLNRALSKNVLVAFHNIMMSKETTNADHEPARRIMLRMFIAICICLTHPADEADLVPQYYLDHTPDLQTAGGLVDYFAIRTFAVLFPALCGRAYSYLVKTKHRRVLPIDPDLWDEVQYAWKQAVQADDFVGATYAVVISRQCPYNKIFQGSSFVSIADSFTVHAAAALVHYHGETFKTQRTNRPAGFTTKEFKHQIRQALGRFQLQRDWNWFKRYVGVSKPAHSCNEHIQAKDFDKLPIVAHFDGVFDNEYEMLFPWNADNLPFELQE